MTRQSAGLNATRQQAADPVDWQRAVQPESFSLPFQYAAVTFGLVVRERHGSFVADEMVPDAALLASGPQRAVPPEFG